MELCLNFQNLSTYFKTKEYQEETFKYFTIPEAVFFAEPRDMTAIDNCSKVVSAPLFPISYALCLLSVGLRPLDVNTGLITQH